MDKVDLVCLVTPLWASSEENQLGLALAERKVRVCIVGPSTQARIHEPTPGVQVHALALPEPKSPFSANLALRLRGPLQALVRRLGPDVVHYTLARWAALGVPPGLPATGYLADQEGSLCPANPFTFLGSGPGWFQRWLRARRARALQIASLARLAGLAVPSPEIGEAAAATQLRGMPLVHLIPDSSTDPKGHAAGLLRLWADLPY